MTALKERGGESARVEAEVSAGQITPSAGARALIEGFVGRK